MTTPAKEIYELAATIRAAGVDLEPLVEHMKTHELAISEFDLEREAEPIITAAADKIDNFYYQSGLGDYEMLWHFWYLIEQHPDEVCFEMPIEDIKAELTAVGFLPYPAFESIVYEDMTDEMLDMAPLARQETGETYVMAHEAMVKFSKSGRPVGLDVCWAAYIRPLAIHMRSSR